MAKDRGSSWRWDHAYLGQIICGLTVQDAECREVSRFDDTLAQRHVEKFLVEYFPFGSTRLRGQGVYRCHPHSGAEPVLVREPSIVVEVLGATPYADAKSFAQQVVRLSRRLATTFKQREVLARVIHPNGAVCVAFIPAGSSKNLNTLLECGAMRAA